MGNIKKLLFHVEGTADRFTRLHLAEQKVVKFTLKKQEVVVFIDVVDFLFIINVIGTGNSNGKIRPFYEEGKHPALCLADQEHALTRLVTRKGIQEFLGGESRVIISSPMLYIIQPVKNQKSRI